ncbi:MAG: hypothetical protein ABI376_00215 [Caulobacteraceae bacterium]
MRAALAAVPLTIMPVALYNLLALAMPGGGIRSAVAAGSLAAPLFSLDTAAGGRWPVSPSDLLFAFALIALFAELVKSGGGRGTALVNHALAMALFVACLVELLIAPAFATSTFFLIGLTVLLDVLAGFIVTVAPPPPE